jgi:hypothetical protein
MTGSDPSAVLEAPEDESELSLDGCVLTNPGMHRYS